MLVLFFVFPYTTRFSTIGVVFIQFFRRFDLLYRVLPELCIIIKMGITGLLPLMGPATQKTKLEKLGGNIIWLIVSCYISNSSNSLGTVAAIDTNGWLHKACFFCGDKIYLNEKTDRPHRFVIDFCKLLRDTYNITPLLVFDGQSLLAKAPTKLSRDKRKHAVREEIRVLQAKGQDKEARKLMRTCVDVTFKICKEVIDLCREEAIDVIVAPFEADAQLTYLVKAGIADYAISEDSDLLVFGCPKVLFKLNKEEAAGQMVDLTKVGKCFKKFNHMKLKLFGIMSGCDYLPNVPGIGITRTRKYFESFGDNQVDEDLIKTDHDYLSRILLRLPKSLSLKVTIPESYVSEFCKALNAFDHQVVFCPIQRKLIHLTPIKPGTMHQPVTEYAGHFFDDKIHCPPEGSELSFAEHYAFGNVNTKNLLLIDDKWMGPDSKKLWFDDLIVERIATASTKIMLDSTNVVEVVDDELILLKETKKVTPPKQPFVKRVYSEPNSASRRQANGDSNQANGTEKSPAKYVHRFNPTGGRKIWRQLTEEARKAERTGRGTVSKYFPKRKRTLEEDSTANTADDKAAANAKKISV